MTTDERLYLDVRKVLTHVLEQVEEMVREHELDLESDFSIKKPKKEEKNA
jgi:hypothetical protein